MKCKDFHGQEHDIDPEEFRTRAQVYGIVFNEDKTGVLTVKHFEGYDYPGGGMRVGQNMGEALFREIKEETGFELDISSMKLLHVDTDLFYHNFKEQAFQTILIYYTCTIISFEIKKGAQKSSSELQYMGEAIWLPLTEVDSVKFYNGVDNKMLLQQALDQS